MVEEEVKKMGMEEWRCVEEFCLDNIIKMIEHDHWRIIEAVGEGGGEEVANELMVYIAGSVNAPVAGATGEHTGVCYEFQVFNLGLLG